MKPFLSIVLEVAGVGLIAGALGWAVHPAVGAAVAGAYMVVAGQVVGRSR